MSVEHKLIRKYEKLHILSYLFFVFVIAVFIKLHVSNLLIAARYHNLCFLLGSLLQIV
jgi:hypothetical protein